jgi:GGDEF domain-containing protein
MESAPLIDQFRFINQTGISLDSYLIRKHSGLSEAEFEQRIARGAQTDLLKQKQFYQVLDNQCSLFEVLRKMPLAKVDWIPCVYNLVVCDLVSVTAVPTKGATSLPLDGMGVERAPIQAAMQGIYRQDTGLINYPAILYFLEQEFFRYEHTAAPFSILAFEMCYRTFNGIEPLPVNAIHQAAKRIDSVKRNVDYLAHFENTSFILMMPFTKVQAAALVAKRITDVLWDANLGGGLDSTNLALAFGVAGVPEDCQDLGLLLAAGKQAVSLSKQTGTPVVTFQHAGR